MRRAFGIGIAMLAIAGCGSTKYVTTTQSITSTTTQTKTHTIVKHAPAQTVTVTATSTASAAPVAGPANSSGNGRSFSGNGGETLGTIHVSTDSTIHWTNDGGLFSATDSSYGLYVNSQGHSGTSALPAGTYTGVTVNAVGNWTLQIVPGG
jgi:hypothetical protein